MFIQLDYPKKDVPFSTYFLKKFIYFICIFFLDVFAIQQSRENLVLSLKGHSSVFVKKQTFYCATEIVGQKRMEENEDISL